MRRIDNVGIGDGTMSIGPIAGSVIYTVSSPGSIPGNTLVKIMMERIVNPNSAALNQVAVTTRDGSNVAIDGPTNSATFILVPIDSDMTADNSMSTSHIQDDAITLDKVATDVISYIDGPATQDTVVMLSTADSLGASVPASVTVLEGQTSVLFQVTPTQQGLLEVTATLNAVQVSDSVNIT